MTLSDNDAMLQLGRKIGFKVARGGRSAAVTNLTFDL
jgi:hypothetical protein